MEGVVRCQCRLSKSWFADVASQFAWDSRGRIEVRQGKPVVENGPRGFPRFVEIDQPGQGRCSPTKVPRFGADAGSPPSAQRGIPGRECVRPLELYQCPIVECD